MATPNICRSCARALRSSGTVTAPKTARALLHTARQRSFHTPAPLFLDFLAPSWRPIARTSETAERPSLNRIPQRRTLSSTAQRNAVAITNPRQDDSGNDMTITITPRAAHRLQAIAETDQNPDLALRVSVESGGCHGFQYLMSLTSTKEMDPEEDTIFENEERVNKKGSTEDENGYKAKVIMDEPSLELLKGSSVDYTMELIGSQFKVTGIPGAKSSCGCGTSFDIAA
ncbi:Iron-sulfur assembly protein 2 [Pseudocercospora fuligena]|uniref:Iron-sulfur assembly protein 2 n=1 Tax=Pseudocercospora fuligena TaxID=685502 RepID=A0A8H6RJF0_9PEZI|nr:Iron-sulfur assembly protein 2 [Pseudocercospora fuligena]